MKAPCQCTIARAPTQWAWAAGRAPGGRRSRGAGPGHAPVAKARPFGPVSVSRRPVIEGASVTGTKLLINNKKHSEKVKSRTEWKQRAERAGPCTNYHRRTRRRAPTGKGSACRPCATSRLYSKREAKNRRFWFCFLVGPASATFSPPSALPRHGFRCRTPAQYIDRFACRPGEVPELLLERPPAQILAHEFKLTRWGGGGCAV